MVGTLAETIAHKHVTSVLHIRENINPSTDSEVFKGFSEIFKGLCSEDLSSFSVLINSHSLHLVNEAKNNNGPDPTAATKGIFYRFYGPRFELGLLQISWSKHYSHSFFSFLQ